jgi:hypothetical protein
MLTAIRRIASRVDAEEAANCLVFVSFSELLLLTAVKRSGRGGRMRWAILPALLLCSCVSNGVHPLRPLEIPTAPYFGIVTTALTGTLTYDGGCLEFRADDRPAQLVPIWPDGTTFNGTSITFHRPGRSDQTIVVNEEFQMSGEPMQWARLPGPRIPLHQRVCRGAPFAVADVRPAN